jgi:hypothetical protein
MLSVSGGFGGGDFSASAIFCTPDFRELSKIFLNFLDFRAQQQNTTFKTVFFTPNRGGLGSGANVPGINKRTLTPNSEPVSATRRRACL